MNNVINLISCARSQCSFFPSSAPIWRQECVYFPPHRPIINADVSGKKVSFDLVANGSW